jgi:hypothetical protein
MIFKILKINKISENHHTLEIYRKLNGKIYGYAIK